MKLQQSHLKTTLLLIISVVFFASVESAYAHGAGMTLTSTTTKGYIVDVDYADTYVEAGRLGRFTFGLFTDGTREKQIEYTDMWVRIVRKDDSKVGKTVFAGGLAKQEFGGNGFSFVFPEAGTYTMSVRYNNANKDSSESTVAEEEFELDVLGSPNENKFNFGKEFWIGLFSGLCVAVIIILPILIRRRKS